jgi:hypothetical protein
MTLNSSGTISIGGSTTGQSINLELGRSATATSSLNETDLRTLAGVASGAISLSSFYGKSNADYTPNAVDWADIIVFGLASGTNPNVTITGINQTVTIKLSWTVSSGTISTVEYRINSGSYVSIANNNTFTVVNNDTLNFRVTGGAGTYNYADFTVKNNSTADSTLDTFYAEVDRS